MFFLISILFLLASCQAEAAAVVSLGSDEGGLATAVPLPSPTASPTPIKPPAIIISDSTATPLPSFALADPTQVNAGNATATQAAATTMAQLLLSATPETPPTETTTPQPTFTPPALPFTSNDEHFWLRRPIPEGGTVWTDKVYPYGSTRNGSLRPHHGVEFYVPSGTQILAAASGTIVVAGNDLDIVYGPHTNFYGNLIVIQLDSAYNGQPVYNLYGHLSEVFVVVGQHVDAQAIIALSGATGIADGPHMHFEVRVGSNDYDATRNPLLWLYPFPDNGTVAGRVVWPNGALVEGAPITLRRIDAPSKYHATTSYTGDTVNGDEEWQENFAFDDVVAGYYEVEIQAGSKKYKQEFWVFPYRTSFVEVTLDS
ncbi:MAG: peptidoglycan DD-metalloendopeptidase family protein [Chloroflexota bacterium]